MLLKTAPICSRSVCGRSFDQRQVCHVLLVFHARSAFRSDPAGRAPRGGQTLRPQRRSADLPLRLHTNTLFVRLDQGPGPRRGATFSTNHQNPEYFSLFPLDPHCLYGKHRSLRTSKNQWGQVSPNTGAESGGSALIRCLSAHAGGSTTPPKFE